MRIFADCVDCERDGIGLLYEIGIGTAVVINYPRGL